MTIKYVRTYNRGRRNIPTALSCVRSSSAVHHGVIIIKVVKAPHSCLGHRRRLFHIKQHTPRVMLPKNRIPSLLPSVLTERSDIHNKNITRTQQLIPLLSIQDIYRSCPTITL